VQRTVTIEKLTDGYVVRRRAAGENDWSIAARTLEEALTVAGRQFVSLADKVDVVVTWNARSSAAFKAAAAPGGGSGVE